MGRRVDLQVYLEFLLGSDQVFFQPPSNTRMQYPAIVYSRDSLDTVFADNAPYRHQSRYEVIVMDHDPDSEIPTKITAMPMSRFVRSYSADGLNHTVINLYF